MPFVVFSLALLVAPPEFRAWLRQALLAYAMVILAFVGALHWGFTIKTEGFTEAERWTWMSWSVVPALAAWAAAMVPFRLGIALMMMTFARPSRAGPCVRRALRPAGVVPAAAPRAHRGGRGRAARRAGRSPLKAPRARGDLAGADGLCYNCRLLRE